VAGAELSVPVSTLGCVTATISGAGGQAGPGGPVPGHGEGSAPAPDGPRVPLLDAAATTRCRRRVHLDHDASAASAPRALPDPALEQRRADVREHRARIAETVAGA
jgi:hypothetical protein